MSANIIIDIVFAVVTVLIAVKFTMKGFLGTVLDTLKVILAGFISYLVRKPVAELFDGWFVNAKIVEAVKGSLLKSVDGNDSLINFVDMYKRFPKFFNSILAKFGLGDVSDLEKLDVEGEGLVDGLALEIGSAISLLLSTILGIVVTFIVLLIVFSILVKIFDALTNIKAINFINKLLGFALGLVLSVLVLRLATYVIELLISWTNGFGGGLTQEIMGESMLVNLVKLII